jgi:transglutaminase-like putative cysteine protease
MRICVSHQTTYRYNAPAGSVIQMLRLTPRNHDGQHIADWRVDVSADCRLEQHEDAFGNITHAFTAEGPFSELSVQVEGEVETRDTQGVVRGAVERFPPSLYLRETALTAPDADIAALAASVRAAAGPEPLQLLHAMLERLHDELRYDVDPTHTATTAAEAFALKCGVCQDLTHIFIAAARTLGIPSRYIGGYVRRSDGVAEPTPGPRASFPASAGSHSTPPTASARPMPMSASRSVSIISAPRRCAACAMAAPAKRWRSTCASTRRPGRHKVESGYYDDGRLCLSSSAIDTPPAASL